MNAKTPVLVCLLLLGTTVACNDKDYKAYYKSAEITVTDLFSQQVVQPKDTVSHNNLQLRVQLTKERHLVTNNMWVGNAAYATSRDRNRVTIIEKVKNIKLITLNDYNSNFKAGDDIMDSCYINNVYRNDERGLISSMNEQTYGDVYDYEISELGMFEFKIEARPDAATIQRFALVFETEAGSAFTDTTISFIVKP